MYDVNLQPITSESKIPFDKYLLLYDGNIAVTGRLSAITKSGFQFSKVGTIDLTTLFGMYEVTFTPTHYAILNISIEK